MGIEFRNELCIINKPVLEKKEMASVVFKAKVRIFK